MPETQSRTRSAKKIFRSLIPPIVNDYITSKKWSFEGNYKSFEDALKFSKGYNDRQTVEKVKSVFLEWYRNRADKTEYLDILDQQLLSSFFIISNILKTEELSVLDLGGSFGNHYIQLRSAVPEEICLNWDIIETRTLVKEAIKLNLSDELNFYEDISKVSRNWYDVIFTSGTLQYLPEPEKMFRRLAQVDHSYLVMNRIPFINDSQDRLTVQRVQQSYYPASYPSWFFSKDKWDKIIGEFYSVKYKWFTQSEIYLGMNKIPYEGMLLKKQESY